MPRPLPSYRHRKSRNLAVVTLDGKDHYLGKFGSPESWEKYHRLLGEWMASRRTKAVADRQPDPPTVAGLILAYWDHAQGHYRLPDGRPSGELWNVKVALRPVRKLYGTTLARDFGPLALRAVREEMVKSGLARSSVNARVNRIRRAFRWAASVELVPGSVVQDLATVAGLQEGRTAARETAPVAPVALAAVEATLQHLPRPVAGLVRLQLLTGMRPGEACSMRGRDLTTGEDVWTYKPGSHKTAWRGKRREITLGPRAVELIRGFLRVDLDAFLFDPRDAVADHQAERSRRRKTRATPSETAKRVAIPGSNHNRRYGKSSYRNAVARACDRAFPHPSIKKARGKPLSPGDTDELLTWRKSHRWHPNQLRHSAATEIRSKFGLEAAQVILGHSKADVTQVYAERDLAKAHEVMKAIG